MSKTVKVIGKVAKWSIISAGLLAGAAWLERRSPFLKEVSVPALPRQCPPIRILHISDLHMTFDQKWLVKFVRDLAELKPDFVVSTGDNFSSPDGFGDLLAAYEPLMQFPGAFVFGSNDYYSGNLVNPLRYPLPKLFGPNTKFGQWFDRMSNPATSPDLPTLDLRDYLVEHGWHDLNNATASQVIEAPADPLRHISAATPKQVRISLSGVNDPHIGYDLPVRTGADWQDAQLRLALTHAPYQQVLNQFSEAGADVILAGHTHGGQICLPPSRALTSNCDLPPRYAHGLWAWPLPQEDAMYPKGGRGTDHSWLYISNGLGTSRFFPFRLFSRPSATLLTLHPQTA